MYMYIHEKPRARSFSQVSHSLRHCGITSLITNSYLIRASRPGQILDPEVSDKQPCKTEHNLRNTENNLKSTLDNNRERHGRR
jgi:hypothetical protein